MPYWLWYLFYLSYYNFTHIVMSIISFYIIQTLKHQIFNLQDCLTISWLYWLWLPYLITLVWWKVGSMVDSVEIDEDNRLVRIEYHPFIFWKKETALFSIDDEYFGYEHKFKIRFILRIVRFIVPVRLGILCFFRKKKLVEFYNGAGWSREQMMEIYEELRKLKEPGKYNPYE